MSFILPTPLKDLNPIHFILDGNNIWYQQPGQIAIGNPVVRLTNLEKKDSTIFISQEDTYSFIKIAAKILLPLEAEYDPNKLTTPMIGFDGRIKDTLEDWQYIPIERYYIQLGPVVREDEGVDFLLRIIIV